MVRSQAATLGVLFVALHALARVRAYYLRDNPPSLFRDVDTGQVTSRKYVEVVCDAADWGPDATAHVFEVQSTDRTTTWDVSVRCMPPTYVYDIELTGYIPRDGILKATGFCRVPAGTLINQTYADIISRANLPQAMGRRLLGLSLAQTMGCHGGFGIPFVSSFIATGMAAAGQCDGADVPSQDDIDKLQSQIDTLRKSGENLVDANNNLWEKVRVLNEKQQDFLDNQRVIDSTIRDIVANATLSEKRTLNITTGIMRRVNELSADVQRDLQQSRDWQASTNAQLDTVNSLIVALSDTTDANLKAVSAQMQNTTAALRSALASLTDTVELNRVDARVEAIKALVQLRRLTGFVMRLSARAQDRRALTRTALMDVQSVQTEGYIPFLGDLGTEPTVNPSDFYLAIEDQFVRTIYGSVAYQDRFTTYCDGNFIADSLGSWQEPADILNGLGPANCSHTADSTAVACQCFTFHSASSCIVNASLTADPDNSLYFSKDTSPWYTGIQLTGALHCSNGGPISDVGSLTVLRGVGDLAGVFASMAARTQDHGDATHLLTNAYSGLTVMLPYRDRLVNATLSSLYESRDDLELPRAAAKLLGLSAGRFASLGEAVYAVMDGVMPLGVNVYDEPFSSYNGMPSHCSTSMFMAYTPDWIPQYRFRVRGLLMNMQASITNQVDDGRGTVKINTTDLIFTNDMQMAMPGDILVAGSPFPDARNQIFDVAQRDLSTSPDAGSRAGTVSYALCPNINGCTWQDFLNYTSQRFDAKSGANVAALYARTLLPDANGVWRCVPDPAASPSGPNGACDLRDRFDIMPGDPLNRTAWVRPRLYGSYMARFAIPTGTVTDLVVTECPTFSVQRSTPDGVMLRLSNPRTAAVNVQLFYTGGENCDAGNVPEGPQVSVGAGGSVDVFIPACAGTDGRPGVMYARAQVVGGADCAQTATGDGLDITAPTREYTVGTLGIADVTHVRRTTEVATDWVLAATTRMVGDLSAKIDALTVLQYAAHRQFGLIDTPDLNFTQGYRDIAAMGTNNSAAINETRGNIGGANFSKYETDKAAFQALFDELAAAQRAALEAQVARIDALSNRTALQTLIANDYSNARELVANASIIWSEALAQYVNDSLAVQGQVIQIFRAIKAGLAPGGFSLGDFGDLMGDALDATLGAGGKLFDAVASVAKAVVSPFSALGSTLGNIFQYVLYVVVLIVICCCLCGCVYAVFKARQFLPGSSGSSSSSSSPDTQALLKRATSRQSAGSKRSAFSRATTTNSDRTATVVPPGADDI